MSRLRTYAPMARRSQKVKDGEAEYQSVYRQVDARSGGRCECNEWEGYPNQRCRKSGRHHHHTVKPRRSHHTADLIIHLCEGHHDRVEWPYKRGRLRIVALGGGLFECAIRFASDKFQARA